jgi:hypothetical protein
LLPELPWLFDLLGDGSGSIGLLPPQDLFARIFSAPCECRAWHYGLSGPYESFAEVFGDEFRYVTSATESIRCSEMTTEELLPKLIRDKDSLDPDFTIEINFGVTSLPADGSGARVRLRGAEGIGSLQRHCVRTAAPDGVSETAGCDRERQCQCQLGRSRFRDFISAVCRLSTGRHALFGTSQSNPE